MLFIDKTASTEGARNKRFSVSKVTCLISKLEINST